MFVAPLGKILVCSFPARALFDSGASMCILARRFVEQHSLPTYPLPTRWNIITGNGVVTVHTGCKACSLVISGLELYADFIVHDIVNYDAVLGMDWLARFHVTIDCWQKKVVFQILGHPVFEFRSGSSSLGPVRFRTRPVVEQQMVEQPAAEMVALQMEMDLPTVVRGHGWIATRLSFRVFDRPYSWISTCF